MSLKLCHITIRICVIIVQSYLNKTQCLNKTIDLFSKLSQHNQILFWFLCNVVGKPLDNWVVHRNTWGSLYPTPL